ncbi:hypothetical protein, partial [Shigella boydii]|uniref:hypothetical protein n=2 Tax=Shigella boydii TaxID=621 RepID=UPI00093C52B3
MLKNTFRWRAQKNAAVKAKNGYKYASLPASEKKRIFEMQQIEQRGNDSNLLIVFYVQIMPDDLVMQ